MSTDYTSRAFLATPTQDGLMSKEDKERLDDMNDGGVAVLEFYGGSPRGHVNHGNFWQPSVNLGLCFWEAWIKPEDNASRYLISDGYGGSHAILAGFTQAAPGGIMYPSGNMWTGATTIGWASDEGVYPGEWCHVAWGWATDPAAGGAKALFCYVNGIPVGYVAQNSTRQSPPVVASAGGDLFIGGSDHSNYKGRLAMVRGFENFNPLTYPRLGFNPDNAFTRQSYDGAGTFTDCAFLASYMMRGAAIIPDLSPRGFDGLNFTGTNRMHAGALYGCENLGVARGIPNSSTSTFPRPAWVTDDECPCGSSALVVPTLDVPAASPVPVGALIFDDFNRQQQNFAWTASPSLGSTNAGAALGALAWSTSGISSQGQASPYFGIRHGRAMYLGRTIGAVAWVEASAADRDVRVSRLAGSYGVDETGIAFRYADRDNFWFAYPISGGAAIRVGGFLAGNYTEPSNGDSGPAFAGYSTAAAPNWTRLRVVTSGTTFSIYVGVASGVDANGFPTYTWTLVGTLTSQTALQTATKAGICGLPYNATLISNMFRFDNFEVR